MNDLLSILKDLKHAKAPSIIRALALCSGILFCILEISFHIDYLSTPYGTRAIILSTCYLLWGILFYKGSILSTWVYWVTLFFGSILFITYSDYYAFFSIAVFPLTVTFTSAPYNLVNLFIFIAALTDDVHQTTPFNATAFVIISTAVFYFLPLGIRLHWERGVLEKKKRQNLQQQNEEQNRELARELHDGLARHISTLTLQANKALITSDTTTKNELLSSISAQSRDALDDLRRMMRVLRKEQELTQKPELLSANINLPQALNKALNNLRQEGFTVTGNQANLTQIPNSLIPTVLRIITELTFNISKYAPLGSTVEFSTSIKNSLFTVHSKNPIQANKNTPSTGYGLAGITERINSLGGNINTKTHQHTWEINISLPL